MLVSLTVGKVDAGVAVLLTEDQRLIEFPSILLPPSIRSGSIVDITVKQNHSAEQKAEEQFQDLQQSILSKYGLHAPSAPVLRLRNATQTSIVLEWDPIELATSTLRSLSLYRNGSKAGNIPRPFDMLSTKISGLGVNTEYSFFLVLKTSGGTYTSNTITVKTHEMTNLTGITVTPGILPTQLREGLETSIERIGAKLLDTIRIDTTHFVCTEPRGDLWQKAMDMNIPIVRPEWVQGCEREGKIVGVRGYYLDADPKLRQIGTNPSIQHQSKESMSRDPRSPPLRTSSVGQGESSQTSLPTREPKSPVKEDGEPGPTVSATPDLQQGELQSTSKSLPPDPPRSSEEDEDESDADERPAVPEKPTKRPASEDESDEDARTERNAPSATGKGKQTQSDDKDEGMEEVAL